MGGARAAAGLGVAASGGGGGRQRRQAAAQTVATTQSYRACRSPQRLLILCRVHQRVVEPRLLHSPSFARHVSSDSESALQATLCGLTGDIAGLVKRTTRADCCGNCCSLKGPALSSQAFLERDTQRTIEFAKPGVPVCATDAPRSARMAPETPLFAAHARIRVLNILASLPGEQLALPLGGAAAPAPTP